MSYKAWTVEHVEVATEISANDMSVLMSNCRAVVHAAFEPVPGERRTACVTLGGKKPHEPYVTTTQHDLVTCQDCLGWMRTK